MGMHEKYLTARAQKLEVDARDAWIINDNIVCCVAANVDDLLIQRIAFALSRGIAAHFQRGDTKIVRGGNHCPGLPPNNLCWANPPLFVRRVSVWRMGYWSRSGNHFRR